ncbi:RNA polymerase [Brevibacillus laterosporus]|uniref:RNA polymerase sigma factor n=1 Tax=Brevibacillus TaxID=55080 RepID=UPI000C7769D9|nr:MULTISPECIES: sigma-70 family RNA polymerase sigma factor [Brevibacillus]AUM63613.1 RNA polymerase [Brevibacillus laterosporus]MBA4535296.1 sigma-70 family RNA polymerase sigma factor [Brevibacillus halotolerans]GIO03121.1 ECF RNA polymerase sigma factor SigW [Brevibacillus halotolerans]
MQDDQELVVLVQRGHKEAYTRIVDKYKGKIYAYLYRMIGQQQDAQDMAQDVFLKAYCHIHQYKPKHSFSSWLYRIAANHCIDELRKRKKSPRKNQNETTLVDKQTPEYILLEKERKQILQSHLLALDESYRTVLMLRHHEHFSYKEIGDILEIPVTTVQMRLHRAHKKLRESLLASVEGGGFYDLCEIETVPSLHERSTLS